MSNAYRPTALRELVPEDLDALAAILREPVIMRHRMTGPMERDEVALLLEQAITDRDVQPRQRFRFAVTGGDGSVIGSITLELDRFNSCYAHSLVVHPEVHNRHVGRDVMRLIYAIAFERLDVHRVWGAIAPENTAAKRMVSATGMTSDGRIRDAYRKDGTWYDVETYSLCRSEWARPASQPVADLALVGS